MKEVELWVILFDLMPDKFKVQRIQVIPEEREGGQRSAQTRGRWIWCHWSCEGDDERLENINRTDLVMKLSNIKNIN